MATDATGTPSTNFSFPKYLTSADAPSGLGLNAIVDDVDTKLNAASTLLGAVARTIVRKAAVLVGTRRAINFIEGSGISLTIADNAGTEAVDVTITKAAPARVRATKSGATSITTGTLTVVPFDTESYDNDTIHDNVTNNSRLTATTAGIYSVEGSLVYAATAGGTIRGAIIRKNGGTAYSGNSAPGSGGAVRSDVSVAAHVELSATDYVELLAYHDQGAGLNVESSNGTTGTITHFSMTRIGPLT